MSHRKAPQVHSDAPGMRGERSRNQDGTLRQMFATGVLVPPDDPRALATAISRVLGDRELAASFGKAGRDRARAEFSVDRMATRTLAVYERVLG